MDKKNPFYSDLRELTLSACQESPISIALATKITFILQKQRSVRGSSRWLEVTHCQSMVKETRLARRVHSPSSACYSILLVLSTYAGTHEYIYIYIWSSASAQPVHTWKKVIPEWTGDREREEEWRTRKKHEGEEKGRTHESRRKTASVQYGGARGFDDRLEGIRRSASPVARPLSPMHFAAPSRFARWWCSHAVAVAFPFYRSWLCNLDSTIRLLALQKIIDK